MKTITMKHKDRNGRVSTALKPALATLFGILLMLPLLGQLERDSVKVILDIQELREVKAADLDGDGDQDIIGSRLGWDGHLAFLENTDGQGALAWPRVFGDSVWEESPTSFYHFELGDMDNDGDLDIVDGRRARQEFPYWVNDGQGHFSLIGPQGPSDSWVRDYDIFRVGDLDGNGWQDVLHFNFSNRRLYVNWNPGSGQPFAYETVGFFNFLDFNEFQGLELCDYDLDGDLDVLLISTAQFDPDDQKVLLLEVLQQESGSFSRQNSIFLEYYSDYPDYIMETSVADFDHDGYPDLILSKNPLRLSALQGMMLVRNAGGANFSLQQEWTDYFSHTLADIDADGDQDVLALKRTDVTPGNDDLNTCEWLENNGSFNLVPHPVDSAYAGYHLTTGDLNGDGRPDLLSYRLDGSGLVLTHDDSQVFCRFALDNAGNFTLPSPLTDAFSYIRDFTARDWNGDGAPDILLAAESGLRWIENLSGGTAFSPPRHLWQPTVGLGDFQFTSLNSDGLPDGVGTLPDDDWMPFQLFAWLGDTVNNTGAVMPIPGLQLRSIHHFATGYLDGDADMDIVAATMDEELALVWNELDNGGGFTVAPVSIPLPVDLPYLRELLVADLNQDGAGDLLLQTSGPTYYALHLDGNGAFDDWAAIPGMDNAIGLFTGDYNQDGKLDVRGRFYNGEGHFLAMASFDTLSQSFSAPVMLGAISSFYGLEEAFLNDDPVPGLVTGHGFALNIGNSGYVTEPYLPGPFSSYLPNSLYLLPEQADLNGDGREELLTGIRSIVAYDPGFLQGNAVDGLVLWDTTANCSFDSLYPSLPGVGLVLNSGISEQFTATAPNGHYGFYLPDALQHELIAVPPSNYWDICPPDTILSGDGPHTVHFAASANTPCPLMELDLSIGSIRQCFTSTVSMAYRNKGTVPAAPVTVALVFDERMSPVQSTPAWSTITDTSLVFEFPEVGVGEEGQIVVEMEPDCQNLMLGEVLCYEARITPDSLCGPMLAGWDGASLQASSFCEGDSLAFRVENAGNGAMASPELYQLNIVNDDIVLLESGSLQLGPGEADTIRALANMDAFLFEVEQPDGHPDPEPVSLLASGCLSPLDTGLLNAFPGSNGNGFFVERCGPGIGPYDPNIKVALPEGFGEEHFIDAAQPIQYTIHFQNVGSDMARTVTIRDKLSPQLSLASFRAGPASHAHEWIILPDRTLAVTFPDINLPDSTSNEPGSHGFFSYSIRPADGILPFTRIENEAAIFFDFNPPILTNRTEHLIEKPRVAEAVHATLCPGDLYLGQVMERDTVLQQLFAMPEQDSIIWHHVNVLTVEDTTEVGVSLEEPGDWQGISISQDTMITLTLESSSGCDSIVCYHITLLTRLDNPLWAQDIRLSPNPAKDRVQLSWRRLTDQHGEVRIFHSTGRLVAERRVASGTQTLSWNVHHWPSGVYWAELIVAGQRARWRFVVE